MDADIQQFINKKQELQKCILDYLEHGETIILNDQLISQLDDPILAEDKNEMKSTLYLICKIANNHHRNPYFFEKIEQILLHIREKMTSQLSNTEIFDIFKINKRVSLILIKEKFIEIDQIISQKIEKDNKLKEQYHFYFYPELEEFLDEETKEDKKQFAHEISGNNFGLFETKRRKGENDTKICELIQNDSIDEFIQFVEQQKINLNETIEPSIFETNSLLIKKKPTLIEYTTFFGSLNIFNYLIEKQIELKPSLWIYSIHSQKEELINLLHDKNVQYPNNSIQSCIDEAVKCHHNDLVELLSNFAQNGEFNVFDKSVKFLNYVHFPTELNDINSFYYLCQNDNLKIVEILLKNEDLINQINTKVVFKIIIFFNRKFQFYLVLMMFLFYSFGISK